MKKTPKKPVQEATIPEAILIDSAATEPTPPTPTPEEAAGLKKVNFKCRKCGCNQAYVMPGQPGQDIASAHMKAYQCTKCPYTWMVPTGGAVSF